LNEVVEADAERYPVDHVPGCHPTRHFLRDNFRRIIRVEFAQGQRRIATRTVIACIAATDAGPTIASIPGEARPVKEARPRVRVVRVATVQVVARPCAPAAHAIAVVTGRLQALRSAHHAAPLVTSSAWLLNRSARSTSRVAPPEGTTHIAVRSGVPSAASNRYVSGCVPALLGVFARRDVPEGRLASS
jgi:hypothetical protein